VLTDIYGWSMIDYTDLSSAVQFAFKSIFPYISFLYLHCSKILIIFCWANYFPELTYLKSRRRALRAVHDGLSKFQQFLSFPHSIINVKKISFATAFDGQRINHHGDPQRKAADRARQIGSCEEASDKMRSTMRPVYRFDKSTLQRHAVHRRGKKKDEERILFKANTGLLISKRGS